MHRNFGNRSWTWFTPGVAPKNCPRSSPSTPTIYGWVAQADRDAGTRHDGLTSTEHEELSRLRRENRQLKLEREILAKAAAWFARETGTLPDKGSSS